MLNCEREIQRAINEAGVAATRECLMGFDTDGSKLQVGGRKMTTCGRRPKDYQTPYGVARIERHVYQDSGGGATYCPLEYAARIMRTATPLFAKQVSFKYTGNNASAVVMDLEQHGRAISGSYVREVAADVASVVDEKEGCWSYPVPAAPAGERVRTIGVGIDGTTTFIVGEAYRQVMVGTIAFFDDAGERVATTYIAAAPEPGRATFLGRMDTELARVREAYPDARYAGIADGAHDLWEWLGERCGWQILDFWHAAEYLADAAPGMCRKVSGRSAWLEGACHRLKHDAGAAGELLGEFEAARAGRRDGSSAAVALDKAISYFGNHLGRMDYHLYRALGLPIGSGVTEAACKSIVKARLGGSGMQWTLGGVEEVLALRTLVKSAGRWEQFWSKTEQFGFSKINTPKRAPKH
jgi:hypothetical protein